MSDFWRVPDPLLMDTDAGRCGKPTARFLVYGELPLGWVTAANLPQAAKVAATVFADHHRLRVESLASAEIALEDERVMLRDSRLARLEAAVHDSRRAPETEGRLTGADDD